jgi:hypothetical protein
MGGVLTEMTFVAEGLEGSQIDWFKVKIVPLLVLSLLAVIALPRAGVVLAEFVADRVAPSGKTTRGEPGEPGKRPTSR